MLSRGWMPNKPKNAVNSSAGDVRVEPGELALHALGAAGRARGVVHRRAGGPVVRHVRGLAGEPGVEVGEARDGADREPGAGRDPGLVGRGHGQVGEPLVA